MTAAGDWADALAGWGIPDDIVAAAPESPWGFPIAAFRRRTQRSLERTEPSATTLMARQALPAGGSVLDVGVGAGSTSLPLADAASSIVAVDASAEMLAAFSEAASRLKIQTRTVLGTWPDVAARTPPCDVVTCGHVFYNVPDLPSFARALTDHARERVVVEITGSHPLSWMNDLWLRFHGLERPDRPTADDAEAVLRELGLDPLREDRDEPGRGSGFERREEAIALVRRRLCLSPERDDEVAEALGDRLVERDGRWSAGPERTRIVTLWWYGAAPQERSERRSD
jgi:SAM-dependent methyltransferase